MGKSTSTESALTIARTIHPGEILREEFLAPLGMTPYALAKALRIERPRIEKLVREKTPVTPDTALRLARYFGTSPEMWLNMQASFDLRKTSAELAEDLNAIVPRRLPEEA